MNKLAKEIAIEENCFTFNNVLYERLYNHPVNPLHPVNLKYRFFFDEDYDYVEDIELVKILDKI